MRKETRCSTCVYHGDIPSGGITYCDYLSLTWHRRPCHGGEKCTEYKQIDNRRCKRKDDGYGHN